ncbi:hypothetical protein ScPMuIL_009599 [Solemya velum]
MGTTSAAQEQVPADNERALATIYGQCVGDAIGLLTEFLSKKEAKTYYGSVRKALEFEHKKIVPDMHRERWKVADWTDDSDQMILIMLSLIESDGKADPVDFGKRLKNWMLHGFEELGDHAGLGIGRTTDAVLSRRDFIDNPHQAAEKVWIASQRQFAPNGAVMRTSIVGVYDFNDLDSVASNALTFCKVTHADPRCQASVVAVSVAIALMMLRGEKYLKKNGDYKVDTIILEANKYASTCLSTDEEKKELWSYMKCHTLKWLKLDEESKIGYTYKCMGAGFWALKQNNFRETIQNILMEGGDADTNCSVAGAMLGCKLGLDAIPASWKNKLLHKQWLDNIIEKFMALKS